MGKSKASTNWHGVVFPKDDKGERTTTKFGKKVWSAAAAAIENNEAAVEAINNEKDWRHKYGSHVVKFLYQHPEVAGASELGKTRHVETETRKSCLDNVGGANQS